MFFNNTPGFFLYKFSIYSCFILDVFVEITRNINRS